jgi:hypothetical protein
MEHALKNKLFGCGLAVLAAILFGPVVTLAAEEAEPNDEAATLAKKAQNPVEDMISLPFQNNMYFNAGSKDATIYTLDIMPVIPFKLNEEWNLITRTIIPITNQPSLFPGMDSAAGLGDINPTFFFSPVTKPGEWIWGVGPTFTLPTHTDDELGTDRWSAGPAVVLLTMQGHWVVGALANNQWSFAGPGDKPDHSKVDQLLVQPFANYNLPKGWYICSSPIITADWEADSGQKWTVPLGGGFGRLVKVGKMPVNFQLQAFSNVVHPDYGPDWSLRFQIQLLFPK